MILFLTISCGEKVSKVGEEENIVKPSSVNKNSLFVKTLVAANLPFSYTITSNGKVTSMYDQIIASEISGTLVSCNAKIGKIYQSGEVIGQLDATVSDFKIERAKLNQFNLQKEYESQLLSYESLFKEKDSLQISTIKRKLQISTGLFGVEQDLKEAYHERNKLTIKAPFYCKLANVNIYKGKILKPGEEMFRAYDPLNLLLEIKLLQTDIARINGKINVEVFNISDRTQKYMAELYDINPYVDDYGTVITRFRIISNNVFLFPGMNCKVVIKMMVGNAIFVPKEAIVERNGKFVVFTFQKGLAKWKYVTLGRDNGTEVEILDGIISGDKVIITNNQQLINNSKVEEIIT